MKCSCCTNDKAGSYTEIPNHGVYCSDCLDIMAAEGLLQAQQDVLELGEEVVIARFEQLQRELANPTLTH